MGIVDYAKKALGIAPKTDKRHLDNVLNTILYGNLVGFNDVVFYNYSCEDYIKKGYKSNPEVYSIINKIVQKTLIAPIYLYEEKPDQKAKVYKNCKKSKSKVEISKYKIYTTKALEFANTGQDLQALLENPNPKQSWRDLSELGRIFYNAQGEYFLYRETADDSDIALELYVAPANLMTPVYGGGDVNNPITGWKLNLLNGFNRTIDAKDVLQIKRPNPEYDSMGSQDRGMSPLESGLKYLQLNDASLKAWINSTENEGAKGILSPNHADPKLWLTPDQNKATTDIVDKKINGTDNKNKVVVSSMPLQYTSMALSPTALAVLEGLKWSGFKLPWLWGVNPVIFNENPIQHNLEEAKLSLVTDVVVPYLSIEEDALNRWLVKPFADRDKKSYKVDYDVSVYDELKLSTDEAEALLKVCTINEVRIMLGYDESEEEYANQIFVAGGLVPLSDFSSGLMLGNEDVSKSFQFENIELTTKAEILKGCLMFYPDIDINEWVHGIRKLVPNHIVDEYEFEPHLTVLYGFDDMKMNTDKLSSVVNDFIKNNPISIKADRIGLFSNEKDVIKINVEDLNGNLTRLNKLVKSQFEYQNDYPDYKPHITIAYTKKGSGAYLEGSLIDLKDYGLKDLNKGVMKYSDSDKNKTVI